MAMKIVGVCHGCGKNLHVEDDYRQKKVRCPECGVIGEVRMPATASEPPTPVKKKVPPGDTASSPATLPRPPAPPAKAPTPKPAKRPVPPKPPEPPPPAEEEEIPFQKKVAFVCRECGKPVKIPANQIGRPDRCPHCDAPATDASIRAAPALVAPEEPMPSWATDDGQAYALEGGAMRRCPNCSNDLEPYVKICERCTFNLETGQVPVKVYKEVKYHWEAGWPRQRRWLTFLIAQGIFIFLSVVGVIVNGEFFVYLGSWPVFTGMVSFLLGTFDVVDLARDTRGKATLTKTWYVCFFRRPTQRIRVNEYEAVKTGMAREVDFWDWFLAAMLFGWGCVPGILWWMFVIHPDNFYAALCKDHGSTELLLYRGLSQERVEEIAKTVRDVCQLPAL